MRGLWEKFVVGEQMDGQTRTQMTLLLDRGLIN